MIRLVRITAIVIAVVVGMLVASSLEAGANPLAPSEPRNLRATSGETIELVWDAPETNSSTVSEYRVYRGTTSGALDLHATTTELRFSEPAGAGDVHYYAVSAVGIGEGPRTPEVRAGSLVASAPEASGTASRGGQVRRVHLTWEAPVYPGASPITEYRVYNLGRELLGTASSDARELTVVTSYDNFSITAVNAYSEGRHDFVDVTDGTWG